MFDRYTIICRLSGRQHGAVSVAQLDRAGVDRQLRSKWVRRGLLERAGPRSFFVAGSAPTWRRAAWAAAADVEGRGFLAGRTAACLHGLDDFAPGRRLPEVLVRRDARGIRLPYVVRSTILPLELRDTSTIDGVRCLNAERLIIEAPLFGFTAAEVENAIDSAIRKRKAREDSLRERVLAGIRPGVAGGHALREALVDTGGESRLERWFLEIVRAGGLVRPEMRVVCRAGNGFAARLDARFPDALVVELEGHATHSSRRQRQHDEERRTTLTLKGFRVIVFTYNDVRDRPQWVVATLRRAVPAAA